MIDLDSIVRITTTGNDIAATEYTLRFEDGTELTLRESDDPEEFRRFQRAFWEAMGLT